MHEQPILVAQRAIVLQVLRDDHAERWTVAELESELAHLPGLVVRQALGELEAVLAVVPQGAHVAASPCARRLDELGLIAV